MPETRTLWAASVLVAGLLLQGCAGVRAPTAVHPAPGRGPWGVPASAYGTQRLFRLHYEGPDGEATFRLVLRLQSPDRYRLLVSDRFGRSLLTLESAPSGGYLLDDRRGLACPLSAGVRLAGLPIEPLPVRALPAVLLGRLPEPPGGGQTAQAAAGGTLKFRDASGRLWSGALGEDGQVRKWTLWKAGEPVLWWRSKDGQAFLSDRERGAQASWHEVGHEPLATPLPDPAVPMGFTTGECSSVIDSSEPDS